LLGSTTARPTGAHVCGPGLSVTARDAGGELRWAWQATSIHCVGPSGFSASGSSSWRVASALDFVQPSAGE
jgi:hypothetical protein